MVACTDEAALAVLRAATELGRKVPGDLTVVSIDGTQRCETSAPALTAATAGFPALAHHALQTITGTAGPAPHTQVPMTFHRRESCGCHDG